MSIEYIQINNASTISQSYNIESFGGTISFLKKGTHEITAVVSDISNPNGDLLNYQDIIEFQNYGDYNTLNINGIILPRAKITSFSVENGNWNKNALVNLTIETIDESQDLTSIGAHYSDFESAFGAMCCKFVDSISESISLSRGENSISFSKEVSIKFSDSFKLVGPENPVVKQAQAFARVLFDYDKDNGYAYLTSLPFGFSEPDIVAIISDKDYKKFTQENLNLITNECSFIQTLDASNIITDYAHDATQEFSKDERGIVTVTENGNIKGLVLSPSLIASAEAGYAIEIVAARDRIDEIFAAYKADCPGEDLYLYIVDSKTTNEFTGEIEYSISATNDPQYKDSENGIRNQRSISIAFDGSDIQASENGTIEGLSDTRLDESGGYVKYNQAKTQRSSILNGIKARLDSATPAGYTLSPKPTSREERHSPWKGTIDYTHTYSSSPMYAENDGMYKKINYQSQCSDEADSANFIEVINNPIVVMRGAGKTQISQSMTADYTLKRISPTITNGKNTYNVCLNDAKTHFNSIKDNMCGAKPINQINSASVSYEFINDVKFNLSVSLLKGLQEK